MNLRHLAGPAVVAAALIVGISAVAGQTTQPPRPPAQAAAATERLMKPFELPCAPEIAEKMPSMALQVTGALDVVDRIALDKSSILVLNGGSEHGLQVGQEYLVRRALQRFGDEQITLHNTARVRILAVDRTVSTATVTSICDAILPGDYLEPYVPRTVPVRSQGEIRYEDLGRIVSGAEARLAGGAGDFLIIDRGSDHGLKPGHRFKILRAPKTAPGPLVEIGEGLVVIVRPASSTVEITKARDAVYTGDFVAIRR